MIDYDVTVNQWVVACRMQIQYRFFCGVCGVVDESTAFYVRRGGLLCYPTLPAGWQDVDGEPICPAHKVEVSVKIDGKEGRLFDGLFRQAVDGD